MPAEGALSLQTRGLRVRYGGVVANDDISLSVNPGKIVGLIGPNGAGKTTFFNAISGVVRPTAGSLAIQGRELGGSPPHAFARAGVARTFQTPRVFSDMTVAANIDFGLQFAGRRRPAPARLASSDAILDLIGLADRGAARAGEVTPSQQRLLEIGMALATRPSLLLLDEVAAGLTEKEVEATARLIRSLRDELGLCVVWIEHAVGTLLRHVERVIVLHQGRKLADGTPAAVIANAEVVEAYLGDEMVEQVT
jgi:branched-chain amino acid transport system ATP-binding protein